MLRIHYRPKLQKAGNKPYLYCRIRLNGIAATDFSTGILSSEGWDQSNQRFSGKGKTACTFNAQLETISNEIRDLLADMKRLNPEITATQLRNAYVKRDQHTLLTMYRQHEDYFRAHLGQPGFKRSTLVSHTNLRKNMELFLVASKRKDIDLREITYGFGRDFVKFLREKQGFGQNHLVRNLNQLKKMVDNAVDDELLGKNPLNKVREKKVPPGPIAFYTESEVALLSESRLFTPAQQRVVDATLFVCQTGLAYGDLARFNHARDITVVRGRRVIIVHRNKSSVPCFIPVFEEAERILRKYDGKIPVISNQKMNEVLKEIAKVVGIDKNMTTHLARKTAGTFLLNHDVPMGTVSKILGHKSILTTEKIYAHLLDETVLRHTEHLV